jgi:Protein of unknown function (DUF2855)
MQTSFRINRKDFSQSKFTDNEVITSESLAEDELLLKIDFFSFTTNNITYAMVGERIGYWQFFPTEADFGIIPTWGFAEVVISKHPQVAVGERFYGYYPFATHLKVKAGKVKPTGFLDISPHRLQLPIIYNTYTNVKQDPLYQADKEKIMSIFRPLFVTSFLLDDFFEDNLFFDSSTIILTGASSKTALGLAYHQRAQNTKQAPKIVGLTSATNLEFVKQLNLYTQVLLYEEITQLDVGESYSVVDFAGNQIVQKNLQVHLGNQLKYNCSVGMTHWDKNYLPEHKAPNKPILFFAPTHAQKRVQEWGNEAFQGKLAQAWKSFVSHANHWLVINEVRGKSAIQSMYLEMLNGKIDPKNGHIVYF